MLRYVKGVVMEPQVDGFSVIGAGQVGGMKHVLGSEPEIIEGPGPGLVRDVPPLPSPCRHHLQKISKMDVRGLGGKEVVESERMIRVLVRKEKTTTMAARNSTLQQLF